MATRDNNASVAQRQQRLHNKSHLKGVVSDEPYDLIGVGFGPANLSLAIALHDELDKSKSVPGLTGERDRPPKVLFLERQEHYGWHRGMLLPGTKMQISFVKDLATLRDPRSQFTFVNYLHNQDRLVQFTNLDTFTPARIEYHDYMEWCASFFDDVVSYGKRATKIRPVAKDSASQGFHVDMTDVASGRHESLRAKRVVIAMGGQGHIPAPFPWKHPRVIHSSQYALQIGSALADTSRPYKIAVVGSGQSSAEIFNDLHTRYPNASTRMIFRSAALKPSDDSPFVNEIFDPDRVDDFYSKPVNQRVATVSENKQTNYSVVRIGLLEHIYSAMYTQRLRNPDSSKWQHQILNYTAIVKVEEMTNGVRLHLKDSRKYASSTLDVDAVMVATGYKRDVHETMLAPCRSLMPASAREKSKCSVTRDYRVEIEGGTKGNEAGVWLTGCNEDTHGLADTLLSVLAPRGGELVQSMFGEEPPKQLSLSPQPEDRAKL